MIIVTSSCSCHAQAGAPCHSVNVQICSFSGFSVCWLRVCQSAAHPFVWQVKDALVDELSARDKTKAGAKQVPSKLPKASSKYSRLEADISSMQRDSATYCEEPADSEDYQAWRARFDLSSYRPAVEALTQENAFMAELQARIVPIIVEYDAFWTRYFYQLHLLEVSNALLCVAKCATLLLPTQAWEKLPALLQQASRRSVFKCFVMHGHTLSFLLIMLCPLAVALRQHLLRVSLLIHQSIRCWSTPFSNTWDGL